ncbi:MAG: VCBS repeat-containing protein [Bacteroidota bacterium]
MPLIRITCFIGLYLLFSSCGKPAKQFEKIGAAHSGIDFTNMISETAAQNVLMYEYYYNGNGVAVGDLNQDGLTDLFFTGNQTPSKLYLNKGNFVFDDVTEVAAVAGKNAWRTGANMADVNGDGLLDIYVCYSGFGSDTDRANQLFINQGKNKEGIPVFTEEAASYGLDAPGTYTSQSAFFDFDLDGDLDMFLLNHAKEFYSPFYNTTRLRNLRHPQFGNRLYRNDNGKFIDVSDTAGIFGSGLNFGLGIGISDLNDDGWPDILVSNDFNEQDFLYLNNHNGTFREVCKEAFAHSSRSTMGIDIADYNNDLLPDVITMDMLAEDNYRQKVLKGGDEYDQQMLMRDSGYGYQYTRNMLQLNTGFSKDSVPTFSEIGQLSGVSNTDWSWAALFTDLDNDGYKDLFITNGFLRDYTNLDFVKYSVAEAYKEAARKGLDVSDRKNYEKNMPLFDLVKTMPSTLISNYVFRNKKDLTFSNESVNWGLDEKGVSSGAAYADLDNDGDMDLVVCNNNEPVWLYRNHADDLEKNNYIKVSLSGDQKNLFGLGAKVFVYTDSGTQMQEMYPVRGYQSSVDYVLNFGIGKQQKIKQVKVAWNGSASTVIDNPAINTTLNIKKTSGIQPAILAEGNTTLFEDITASAGIDFLQKENIYVDFKREFLIPFELSKQGPKMSKGDVNGDGLDDVFIGGPAGQPGALYVQFASGNFKRSMLQPWEKDAACEDIGSVFFDADNDGDADLYVVSGSNEWMAPGPELQDRLYLNDGRGNFSNATAFLPQEAYSGSCVSASDFDKDGDIDLFIGDRTVPGMYPMTGGNILLRNDLNLSTGKVLFSNITPAAGGEALFNAGMVTDASWSDLDKDGWPDLIVAGDWMPVKIFHNDKGKKFSEITESSGLSKSNGFWSKILPADVDGDGDTDLVVGNMGTNNQYKCSANEPLVTYAHDFNNDGRVDPVMTRFIQGKAYPTHSRDELIGQMPNLNKKFLKYADYAVATIEDIFSKEQIADAKKFYCYTTESVLLINNNGKFSIKPLPVEAQFSCVNGIAYSDYDEDGKRDLFLSGNFFPFNVQQGNNDAGRGLVLKGSGTGEYKSMLRNRSGLHIAGDSRDMITLNENIIVVSKNNAAVQVIRKKNAQSKLAKGQ